MSYGLVPSKCDAAKFKAAASLAQCHANAESKSAKKGLTVSTESFDKCATKFDASCAKAEIKLDDCSQVGTCPEISASVRCCGGRGGWDGQIKGRVQ